MFKSVSADGLFDADILSICLTTSCEFFELFFKNLEVFYFWYYGNSIPFF